MRRCSLVGQKRQVPKTNPSALKNLDREEPDFSTFTDHFYLDWIGLKFQIVLVGHLNPLNIILLDGILEEQKQVDITLKYFPHILETMHEVRPPNSLLHPRDPNVASLFWLAPPASV